EAAYGVDDFQRRALTREAAQSGESGRRQIGFRSLTCAVPEGYVSDLVRERPGQFAFSARGLNRPASYINRPARERERVHLGDIGGFETIRVYGPRNAARARDQSLAETVDIFIYAGVGNHWQALLDCDRRPPANLHFLFGRQQIEPARRAALPGLR